MPDGPMDALNLMTFDSFNLRLFSILREVLLNKVAVIGSIAERDRF